ncbi:hypothetical protein [Halobacillus litoralis]|uniref:hypothetical protein n=1 Tax=Halobacillus litoralis TaxID=45668 RepID=UPI001CFE3BE6|nr:hypothetical protein [Halobacillus litoralis]
MKVHLALVDWIIQIKPVVIGYWFGRSFQNQKNYGANSEVAHYLCNGRIMDESIGNLCSRK